MKKEQKNKKNTRSVGFIVIAVVATLALIVSAMNYFLLVRVSDKIGEHDEWLYTRVPLIHLNSETILTSMDCQMGDQTACDSLQRASDKLRNFSITSKPDPLWTLFP
jgi:hypothetical protein